MPASTIQIVGNDIIMPALGLVDGVDVGVAVPAAASAASAAQTSANSALASLLKYCANWGSTAAPAVTSARYFNRTNGAIQSTVGAGGYPAAIAGTFTFTLTWRIEGTPLVTDSVTLTVMKNGVATTLTSIIAAGATSGQASGSITVAIGDTLAVRTQQSASEAQAAWNPSVSLIAQ